MAYTKQTWNIGETLSAEKFNHLENGITNHFILVTFEIDDSNGTITCSDSFTEAKTAMQNGIPVLAICRAFNTSSGNVIAGTYLINYSSANDCLTFSFDHYLSAYTWHANGTVSHGLC